MQITSFKLLVLTRNEIGGDPGTHRSVLEKRVVGTENSVSHLEYAKSLPWQGEFL